MISLTLPWPTAALHPNARVHWAVRAKAAKGAREWAFWESKCAAVGVTLPPTGKLALRLVFVPPDRRRRDDDGLVAAFKPYRDGIADGLGIDDNRFVCTFGLSDEVTKGGAVRVEVSPCAA